MKKIYRYICLLAFFALPSVTQAGMSPLGFSLLAPVQFPPTDFTVAGARVSLLYGHHRDVYGFDFSAIGNQTDVNFVGIAASGGFNYNKGTSTIIALQLAGLFNQNVGKTNIYGIQASIGMNSNTSESSLVGLGISLVNYSPAMKVVGAQLGLYNHANTVTGFQIGLYNETDVLHGVQIGLLNVHRKGLFSMAPIINIGF